MQRLTSAQKPQRQTSFVSPGRTQLSGAQTAPGARLTSIRHHIAPHTPRYRIPTPPAMTTNSRSPQKQKVSPTPPDLGWSFSLLRAPDRSSCSHPALLVGGAGGALVARWELLGARLPRVLGLRPGGVQGGGQGAERAAAGLADDQHDEQIGCAAPPPLALRLATGAERLRLAAFAGFGLGESARSEDKTARSKQATFGARSSSAFLRSSRGDGWR